ncbi:MAG TPA: hypothetical protein DDX72_04070 [Ruminococcaceae bacterium]|nr:hypothetical protein [Oscillospiraceae bacterium]
MNEKIQLHCYGSGRSSIDSCGCKKAQIKTDNKNTSVSGRSPEPMFFIRFISQSLTGYKAVCTKR